MRLSNITIVALRLFSIYWAVNAVIGILALLGSMPYFGGASGVMGILGYMMPFVVPVIYGLFALLGWRFAEPISRCVVGGTDPNLEFQHITAGNLYTMGAFSMGLYFSLSHLDDLALWLYYVVANRTGNSVVHQQDGVNLYQFSLNALPFAAGVALVFMASTIGKRLAETGSLWGTPKREPEDDSPERW